MNTEPIIFKEYSYSGLSGYSYHPSFYNGMWYLSPLPFARSLEEIALLCKMTEDEAVFLKLKYGG